MLGKVGAGLVGEQGVHEHVLLAVGQIPYLVGHLVVGGGHQRARCDARVQDLGVASHLRHDLLVHVARGLAVVAAHVVLHLLGDDAPALAGEHVEHRLRAHDLRHGGHERRIAHLGANLRNLRHHLGQAVGRLLHLQLADEVAHHAAGHLVGVHLHVDERGHAALVVAALAHLLPVLGDLEEQIEIQIGVVAALLQGGHDHLDGRVRVAEGERRVGGVGHGHAGLGGLQDIGRGHAADVVAVDVHRQADFLVEGLHHALGAVRGEHAGHVLDGDGVGAQILQLLAVLQVGVQRVHRRDGIGDGALEQPPVLLDGLGVVHHVADVVQRVEHAENLDAVAMRRADEAVHDLARVMLVADQVLAARQHGERGVGRVGLDGAQALPGILVQKAQARVERRTAPRFDGPVADAVHLRQDRQHVADLHAGGPQALLTVADGRIHDLKPWHELTPPYR